jgi:predicted kinase
MATAFLIHGYLCVGKSTLARTLEREHQAVRLSIDEWMIALYGDNTPDRPWTRDRFDDYFGRVRSVLDDFWPQLLGSGANVVLDYGFWRRADRDEARRRAAGAGAEVRLIEVRYPDRLARERCRARNRELVGSFPIDDEAYETLRSRFERLGADEVFDVVNSEVPTDRE